MHARKLAALAACTCLALTGCHSPSQTGALSDDHFHPDDSTTAEAIPSETATSEATDITDEQWQAMASAIPSDFDSPSPTVPAEYENALEMAQGYSDKLHMSKARLYDQLTSQHENVSTRRPLNMPSRMSMLTGRRTPWRWLRITGR